VLFEEGQSRRRVAEEPTTGVVVKEGVRFVAVDIGVEFEFEFESEEDLDLCDCASPTPHPTAAPITAIEMIPKTTQKVFGLRPHSFCGGGGGAAGYWYWDWSP
jgi:hypothetical protein